MVFIFVPSGQSGEALDFASGGAATGLPGSEDTGALP